MQAACTCQLNRPAWPPESRRRLWDLKDLLTSASGSGASSGGAAPRCRPACTYTGHRNQRNFVGLSVAPSGHILCGSEDNSVYAYYRSLPFPTARYAFAPTPAPEPAPAPGAPPHQPFVSAVAWANRSRHCVAANSQGLLHILELE